MKTIRKRKINPIVVIWFKIFHHILHFKKVFSKPPATTRVFLEWLLETIQDIDKEDQIVEYAYST